MVGPFFRYFSPEVSVGLNDHGQLAFWIQVGNQIHAAFWNGAAVVGLGAITGFNYSVGRAINEKGDIVGWMNNVGSPVDSGSSKSDSAIIDQWPSTGGANQQWNID